jgi:hypothetical protein
MFDFWSGRSIKVGYNHAKMHRGVDAANRQSTIDNQSTISNRQSAIRLLLAKVRNVF